jgi:hypothetical protein
MANCVKTHKRVVKRYLVNLLFILCLKRDRIGDGSSIPVPATGHNSITAITVDEDKNRFRTRRRFYIGNVK